MSNQKLSIFALTRVAAAAISAHQQVGFDGGVATAGGPALGTAQTAASIGSDFSVDVLGTQTGIASGAITDGMELEVGAAGALVQHTTGTIRGVALEDASDGEVFEFLAIPYGVQPGA